MYEQNDVPVFRHILRFALLGVVTLAVLWVLVWLIFFRHSAPAVKKTPHVTGTSQQAPQQEGSSATDGTQTTPSTSSAGTPATTPSQLVNTGAGNTVALTVVATTIGAAAYHIRLRRKAV